MSNVKKTRALAAAAVAATAGLTASPASAAITHPAAPVTTAKPHGFVPRPGPATGASRTAKIPDRPNSIGPLCSSSNGVAVCGAIYGNHAYVRSMSIWECPMGIGAWVHGEIVSPHGHFTSNAPSYFRSNYNCTPAHFFPFHRNVTPGDWQFRAWQKISAHHYKLLATLKLGVAP